MKKWAYALKLLRDNGKAFRICLPCTNEYSCRIKVYDDGLMSESEFSRFELQSCRTTECLFFFLSDNLSRYNVKREGFSFWASKFHRQ